MPSGMQSGAARSRSVARPNCRACRRIICCSLGANAKVMTLVVAGLLNKQAGGELGISEITVKAHRGNVMRKMKADSFADLINMAARLRVTRSLAHAPFRGDDS